MKKLNLFLLSFALLAFIFTGCEETTEDEPPTIQFVSGTGFVTGDVTVEPSSVVSFKILAQSNANSGSNLELLEVFREGVLDPVIEEDLSGETFTAEFDVTAKDTETTELITVRVTDKAGEQASISFTITTEGATTALSSPISGTWQRIAGAAGTGLSTFGLKWTSNTASNAIISKDGAEKFVQLADDAWTTITTQEALAAAVDGGTDLGTDGYRGVSVSADGTYNDVLATRYNGKNYMILIESADVTVGGSGTTITISIKSVE